MRLPFVPVVTLIISCSAFGQVRPSSVTPRSINPGGVVNAASYTAPVAPGSVATAFGTFAVSGVAAAPSTPLPDSLLGLSLGFSNSSSVPLFFVSATQVSFQVPWELAGQSTATLAATVNGQSTTAQTVSLAPFAPGIFTLNSAGSGSGAILDSNYNLLDSTNAAFPGSTYILIYCTGLGAVTNTPPTGSPAPSKPLAQTTTTPTVTIGGVQATNVQFSGLAPGYVGLYQVNVQVPATVATGTAVPVIISIGGKTSNTVTIPVSSSNSAPFNILQTSTNSFTPGASTLSGYPTVTETSTGTAVPSVGFQDGAFVDNKAVYFPWQVQNGGTTWIDAIHSGIPQSVIISYNAGSGVAGFNDPSNWLWFDLTTLEWAGKGTVPNSPAAFQGGAVAGTIVYPAPNSNHLNPVFIAYDASQPLTSPSAYQTFVPPPMGGALGSQYGFCSAVFDGRFIYYAPLADPTTGDSGNILRYDTTMPFSSLSSWANFNMGTSVSAQAESFQSAAYDGNRYVYFIPFHKNVIARYDTWGGGTSPNPGAFTSPASYTIFDPTMLNTAGQPTVAGQGSTANLLGFTGTAVAWDSAHQNEYLYFVPWATFPGNVTGGSGVGAQNPVLQSTTARVRIGTQTGSTWSAIDITSTSTAAASSPDWEIYDLNNLTTNPAWPSAWGKVFPSQAGAFAGQSAIAGWQIAYVTPTPTPIVGFVPDKSQYFVQHSVDHALFDPSGWYVAPVPSGYHGGTMGGGYDVVDHILYPSAPGMPLFAVQFDNLP